MVESKQVVSSQVSVRIGYGWLWVSFRNFNEFSDHRFIHSISQGNPQVIHRAFRGGFGVDLICFVVFSKALWLGYAEMEKLIPWRNK